ncbi:MAG: hypothetical protein AB7G12_15610 [Thermoanaerobaculia bacterium]
MEISVRSVHKFGNSNEGLLLKLQVCLDPGPIPLNIERLYATRAVFGGKEATNPPTSTESRGERAFPLQGLAQPTELTIHLTCSNEPQADDWVLFQLILSTGNRIPIRCRFSTAADGSLSAELVEESSKHRRFLLGFLLSLLVLGAWVAFGDRVARSWPAALEASRTIVPLILGALLGAVALPNLFSFKELTALLMRPESTVAPSIFQLLSTRSWGLVCSALIVAIVGTGLFLGSYVLPDLPSTDLAWYVDDRATPVATDEHLNRLDLAKVYLGVSTQNGGASVTHLASLGVHPWSQFLLSKKTVRKREPAYLPWKLEISRDARTVLEQRCTEDQIESLIAEVVFPPQLLISPCLTDSRPQLRSLLAGRAHEIQGSPESPLHLSSPRDFEISIVSRGLLSPEQMERVVQAWLGLPEFENPTDATMADLDHAFSEPQLGADVRGNKLSPETFSWIVKSVLDRWELTPATTRNSLPNTRSLRRNAILVHLAATLFSFADNRWQDELAQRETALREVLSLMKEKVFASSERGPYPAPSASDDALREFYRFAIRVGTSYENFVAIGMRSAANSGPLSNAAFLREVVRYPGYLTKAGGTAMSGSTSVRRGLLEHFQPYVEREPFKSTLTRLLSEDLSEESKEFLRDLQVGLAPTPIPT